MIETPKEQSTPLHNILHCFGFFGFASGYLTAVVRKNLLRAGKQLPEDATESFYCNKCPLRFSCVLEHERRVRKIFPNLCAVIDEIVKDVPPWTAQYVQLLRQANYDVKESPYTSIHLLNIEDGLLVGEGRSPKDRGEWTLPWPFGMGN